MERSSLVKRKEQAGLKARIGSFVDRTFQYWTIAPMVITLSLLVIYPVTQLVRMSFSEIDIVQGKAIWEYVGLKHLRTALQDPVVPIALRNTLVFVVAVVIIETLLATLISVLGQPQQSFLLVSIVLFY